MQTAEEDISMWKEMIDIIGPPPYKPFVPLTYYDRAADCIRILFRDCSTVEKWESGLDIAFLFANHAPGKPLVGMIIAEVKNLDLPKEKIEVTEILEKVRPFDKHWEDSCFHKIIAIRQGAGLMGMVCDLGKEE